MEKKVSLFLEKININTNNTHLYLQALTHSSYAYEHKNSGYHNERLEFLGDAVLELIVSEYLFREYPDLPEGNLTKMRANLVCAPSLFQVALSLELDRFLLLGKGEEASKGNMRISTLSSALEAIIGAMYLDLGYEETSQKVQSFFVPLLNDLEASLLKTDYKTLLQEFFQAREGVTPIYIIVNESGPDHQKEFLASVTVRGKKMGEVTGLSKQEAQQNAARSAWQKLNM